MRDGCFFGGGEEGPQERYGGGDYYEGVFYYYPAEEEDCVVWFDWFVRSYFERDLMDGGKEDGKGELQV